MFFCLRFSSSGHYVYSVCPYKIFTQSLLVFACGIYSWIEYCEVPRCCHECNMRAHLLHCCWTSIETPQVSRCANHSWQFSQTMMLPVLVLWRKHIPRSCAGNPLIRLFSQLFSPYIMKVLQPSLLQGISHHKLDWLFLLKMEPQQILYVINSVHPKIWPALFLRPQSMPFPFDSPLLSTLHLCIYAARFPGQSLPYSERSGLHFCAGCFQSQKQFLWINSVLVSLQTLSHARSSPAQALLVWPSLFPSPSDSFHSCRAPALGELCHPWISSQPSQAGGGSQGIQVWGCAVCDAAPCPPLPTLRGVTRATPGICVILNVDALSYAVWSHTTAPNSYSIISPC